MRKFRQFITVTGMAMVFALTAAGCSAGNETTGTSGSSEASGTLESGETSVTSETAKNDEQQESSIVYTDPS